MNTPLTSTQRLLLAGLFIAAFGLRLVHLSDGPIEFHATRQYHSALIARGWYYESAPEATRPPDQSARVRDIAIAHKNAMGVIEPRVVEWLAKTSYRLLGEERIVLPRLYAIVFWLLGSVALCAIASRVAGYAGTVIAAAFYLFVPYSIMASRSFQPDPLMVAVMVAAIAAIVSAFHRPTVGRWVLAGGLAGLAAYVKPVSLLFTTGAFVGLACAERHLRVRTVLGLRAWSFYALSLAPFAAYYAYGSFIAGFLEGQSQHRILPRLLGTLFFWQGWWAQIDRVFGTWAFVIGASALVLARPGRARGLLVGLWCGYLVYAVLFSYHIPTHDYYHLPFIPVLALSLGAGVSWLEERLRRARYRSAALAAGLALVIVAVGISTFRQLRLFDERYLADVSAMYERIGRRIGPSARAVWLDGAYGYPLMYHGYLTGAAWPGGADLRKSALVGDEHTDTTQLFARYLSANPEYFIVTDFGSFDEQPALKKLLRDRYPILAEDYNYLIFDLRRSKTP